MTLWALEWNSRSVLDGEGHRTHFIHENLFPKLFKRDTRPVRGRTKNMVTSKHALICEHSPMRGEYRDLSA